ncbi:hypothetical protein H1C71_028550 [Ictidomys tridecemlineatus]|nr:hypothetical protein H1C71_028550 [Ictidomys tridecemlineatus]
MGKGTSKDVSQAEEDELPAAQEQRPVFGGSAELGPSSSRLVSHLQDSPETPPRSVRCLFPGGRRNVPLFSGLHARSSRARGGAHVIFITLDKVPRICLEKF